MDSTGFPSDAKKKKKKRKKAGKQGEWDDGRSFSADISQKPWKTVSDGVGDRIPTPTAGNMGCKNHNGTKKQHRTKYAGEEGGAAETHIPVCSHVTLPS